MVWSPSILKPLRHYKNIPSKKKIYSSTVTTQYLQGSSHRPSITQTRLASSYPEALKKQVPADLV